MKPNHEKELALNVRLLAWILRLVVCQASELLGVQGARAWRKNLDRSHDIPYRFPFRTESRQRIAIRNFITALLSQIWTMVTRYFV